MIPIQTVVEKNGKRGIVIEDLPIGADVCEPGEVLVVWDGVTYGLAEIESDLTVIGPENAIPQMMRCGAGLGVECCIFLTMSPKGFVCQRFGRLRDVLLMKEMKSKRRPTQMYPGCFLPE